MPTNFQNLLGNIDIYLFDQILKGRFDQSKTILDAGCGNGRNLHYFFQNDYDVYGIDENEEAILNVRKLAHYYQKNADESNFSLSPIEHMLFESNKFNLVICSAVLHFAENENHFEKMLDSCWRVLKPGGYFFARLATDIGIEKYVKPLGGGRFLLPDGSERYLVNQSQLLDYTIKLNGYLFEPIKTTNVQNLRSMTTWCVQKRAI